MNTHKGFGLIAALLVVAGLLVVGGGAYVALSSKTFGEAGDQHEQEADAVAEKKEKGSEVDASTTISWKLTPLAERDHIPYTKVEVVVDGTLYTVGDYQGSCSELGASGGVDGKGLLAGELSAVQCWFAGGGDEIGVFAHEDGGYQILVGALEESIEGSAGFRGDFSLNADILP